jgi:hypothetical protein
VAMKREKRSEEVQKALTQLDLYHHSLRLVGEKMISQGSASATGAPDELQEKSLQLIEESLELLAALGEVLRAEESEAWESAVDRIAAAAGRVAHAKTAALAMVNTWRAIEAADDFLAALSPRHGHVRLGAVLDEVPSDEDSEEAALERLFAEYEAGMAETSEVERPLSPPFTSGVLRWRGSQLFYVERAEDSARWVELDPDHDPQNVAEEPGGIEVAEARTIEGYPITLLLDAQVDENEVDAYVRSQEGREYVVSGYQVAAEQQQRKGRRRR